MCTDRVKSQTLTISLEYRAFIEYLDSRIISQPSIREIFSKHPV